MSLKKIKKSLIKEGNYFVPDLKDQVYLSVGYKENERRKFNIVLKPILALMVLVLVSLLLFIKPSTISNSFIIIDINPSIELEVSPKNKIVSISPLNTDGYFFLENLELVDAYLDEALIVIVEEASVQGFFQTEDSKISISAVNKNEKTEFNINKRIEKILEDYHPGILRSNDEITNIARENNVTPGRMYLINKAMAFDEDLNLEEALVMEVKDLISIMNDKTKKRINEYEKNLDELKNDKERWLKQIENEKRHYLELNLELKDLIKSQERLEIINFIDHYYSDYASSIEYKLFLPRIITIKEDQLEDLLNEIFKDLEDFYQDYFDFIGEVIEDNYDSHKKVYKKNIRESDDEAAPPIYDKDFPYDNYKGRFSEVEREVIKLINRMLVLLKNNHSAHDKQIDELYEEYEKSISGLGESFLESEIVLKLEEAYLKYQESKIKHPSGR